MRVFFLLFAFCSLVTPLGHCRWEERFYSQMTNQERFDLVSAANYVCHTKMRLCTCRYIASLMKGKEVDEIRKMFGLPEETAEMKQQIEKMVAHDEWLVNDDCATPANSAMS